MKSNVMPSRVQMEPEMLKQLVKEVPETVATGIQMTCGSKSKKQFRAINLWNLHRNMKSAAIPFKQSL